MAADLTYIVTEPTDLSECPVLPAVLQFVVDAACRQEGGCLWQRI